MWGAWGMIPPSTKQQKKLKEIPDHIFWIKLSLLLGIAGFLLLITLSYIYL